MTDRPIAVMAAEAAPRVKASNYPEPYASMMAKRVKQPLGDLFGLTNFGVNRTVLPPGAVSALHHSHNRQDEFIYVLDGHPTLVSGNSEITLHPGMCAGFAAGGVAHHLRNDGVVAAIILEIGDRAAGDVVSYPKNDLQAVKAEDGSWRYATKKGEAL